MTRKARQRGHKAGLRADAPPRNGGPTRDRRRAAAALEAGRLDEARALYEGVLVQDPLDADTCAMLGAIHGAQGRIGEAIQLCRRAVSVNPDHVAAHYNLGQAYRRVDNPREALASFRRVVSLQPGYAEAWDNLGYQLQEQGDSEGAIAAYREALRLRPDLSGTRYLLAALAGTDTPRQAPADYVRGLFDGYAARFDTHLVEQLQYRVPEKLTRALEDALRGDGLDILDLGCGTGLCGALLRARARTLTGVDLSAGMLEQARRRGIYDELVLADIATFLQGSRASFDAVIAGDVFIYLGDLSDVFRECARRLRPGGTFAFSVEYGDDVDYRLQSTDRYAHSARYLRTLAATNELSELSMQKTVLRQHKGRPVKGYLCILRKPVAET